MAYLAWQILVGLNAEIQLDFMRVGHTRCFVDARFGLLKQKYRRSDVDTFEQLVGVVRSSATMNEAEKFLWEWREWDKYFELIFRPVKNITSYQRFHFSSTNPGFVSLSLSDKYPDKTFKILSAANVADHGLSSATLPAILTPAGMTNARQQYLFQHIRQFCHEESRDITCQPPVADDT